MTKQPDRDCIIVGGGPAGLTAAIYLARFHLRAIVIDAGDSRARLIPRTNNHAGFPGGIAGEDLIARMREQATSFGAELMTGRVAALSGGNALFYARGDFGTLSARSVLLATGVRNHRPDIDDADHAIAVARGLLRYCPICDGYEVTDRRIGVIGTGERGVREALFLRSYSRDVTLIPAEIGHDLTKEQRTELAEAGITSVEEPAGRILLDVPQAQIAACGGRLRFDTIYPALGSAIHSQLAAGLGAPLSDDGCILVDSHQRCGPPGLYAAGDVVRGLDQISHAMGEGGVAATTIRNDLAAKMRLRR